MELEDKVIDFIKSGGVKKDKLLSILSTGIYDSIKDKTLNVTLTLSGTITNLIDNFDIYGFLEDHPEYVSKSVEELLEGLFADSEYAWETFLDELDRDKIKVTFNDSEVPPSDKNYINW